MAYWGTKVTDAGGQTRKAQEPAYGILGSAGGHEGTYSHVDDDQGVVEPVIVDVSIRVRKVKSQEPER